MPIIAIVALDASGAEVGPVNGARWTPYLLFGLLAGVVADRYRRRPILVATDLARAVLLTLGLGVVLAVGGVGAVVGNSFADLAGRWGAGRGGC